jgi:hypothetical protein
MYPLRYKPQQITVTQNSALDSTVSPLISTVPLVPLGPTGPTPLPGPTQRLGSLGSSTPTRTAFELSLTLELILTVLSNCFLLFSSFLSCLVLFCPLLCPVLFSVLSCPVLSCPVLSCPVLSCPVLGCGVHRKEITDCHPRDSLPSKRPSARGLALHMGPYLVTWKHVTIYSYIRHLSTKFRDWFNCLA